MAVLDDVAREAIDALRPYLDEGVAALADEYQLDGEPVLGLEQVVHSLARSETAVPDVVLAPLVAAVDARAAAGGDVTFLRDPLHQIKRP